MTHELANVFGTIDQVSGLVEDLGFDPAIKEAGIEPMLNDVVARIARQTDRGTDLVRRLNTFAHFTDSPVSEFNVGDVVGLIVAVAQRLAGLQKKSLSFTAPLETISLSTRQFVFAEIIFRVLQHSLAFAPRDAVVEVGVEAQGESCVVTVTGPVEGAETEGLESGDVRELVGCIQAEMTEERVEDRCTVMVTVTSEK